MPGQYLPCGYNPGGGGLHQSPAHASAVAHGKEVLNFSLKASGQLQLQGVELHLSAVKQSMPRINTRRNAV